ncbi:MAG: hypothetical protein IH998_12455, partial [Proteobacteria bacterium]|nr:hypothetical protein [Pseudomonadota bacterium]
MGVLKLAGAGIAAVAMMGLAMPAQAQERWRPSREKHKDKFDVGVCILGKDAKKYDEGVALGDILKWANDSSAGEVSIFLDCCFSGALGNLPAVDNTKALLREGVSILTASRGDQPSVETGDGGLFTSLLVDALGGGAADVLGAVTVPSVYAYVEAALGAWDQRPLFKSHVSR